MLGQPDENALGASDVAEPIHVFVLDHFVDELRAVVADHRNAPVNALGYLRVMFAVDDLDETLARLRAHGAELVREVAQYEDSYRLCYVRGPEGILVALAQQLD